MLRVKSGLGMVNPQLEIVFPYANTLGKILSLIPKDSSKWLVMKRDRVYIEGLTYDHSVLASIQVFDVSFERYEVDREHEFTFSLDTDPIIPNVPYKVKMIFSEDSLTMSIENDENDYLNVVKVRGKMTNESKPWIDMFTNKLTNTVIAKNINYRELHRILKDKPRYDSVRFTLKPGKLEVTVEGETYQLEHDTDVPSEVSGKYRVGNVMQVLSTLWKSGGKFINLGITHDGILVIEYDFNNNYVYAPVKYLIAPTVE
jgi:hypothetical protein